MATFREVKRKARSQLHQRLAEPALYLTDPIASPVGITVRLHLDFSQVGELLRGGFADRQEMTPQIIFLGSQIVPVRNGIVVTKDLGAWFVDNTLPANDITIAAEVVRITPGQATGYGWDPLLPYMGLPAPGAIV
jgi:hypothetical protein